MTTKKFNDLKKLSNEELKTYRKEIKPLNPNWHEYTNLVVDYGTQKVACTDRLIEPYVTSRSHGLEVFVGLVKLVKDLKPRSLVDLGCGAGDFLYSAHKYGAKVYGLTIHVGEVLYARDQYKLENVIPADLRDIDEYFTPNSLDMVVVHKAFDFITNEERIETMKRIYRVLKPGKWFVHVDDSFRFKESVLPEWDFSPFYKEVKLDKKYPCQGVLQVFTKNVQ